MAEKLGLDKITSPKVPGVELPGSELTNKVSDLTQALPDLPCAGLPEMNFANLDIPEMPELSVPELQNLDLSPDFTSISKSVKLPEFDKLGSIQSHLGKGEEVLSAFILFNLYDPKHKSSYGDVMSSRFGFEFPLKKKSKATEPSS